MAVRWEWIAFGYFVYLLIVALTDKRFIRARVGTFVGTVVCGAVLGSQLVPWLRIDALTFAILVPLPMLLAGYRLSGLFFVSPMRDAEEWLMALDRRFLRRQGILAAYETSPRMVHESLELAYVLVYLVIPAGVATLAMGGHPEVIPRFWTIVLLAAFISYGVMPWLQTRPPRVLENTPDMIEPQSALRRFNATILNRGSIQANTVPSGHAASAVATGLAVADAMPLAGAVFLFTAACIVVATVLGRYHYLLDSLLGIVVAVVAWCICR